MTASRPAAPVSRTAANAATTQAQPADPQAGDSAATPALEVHDLSLRYGERMALDAVSLRVAPRSLFALLGPNGSGKSTLLRILATLLRPTAGAARIDGLDVLAQPGEARRRLGVVFQAQAVDARLSVLENLRFQGHLHGMSGAKLRRRIDALVERFGLGERLRDRVATLSGGLRRRVELAKALLHAPRLLLLDEPTAGLDLASRQAFWQTLDELRRTEGLTVVAATHLMDEAERCEGVALLDQGRLIAQDRPEALKAELGDAVITLECAEPQALAALLQERLSLRGAVQDGAVRLPAGTGADVAPRLLAAFPAEISALRIGRPTLADVFLARTGRAMDQPGREVQP